MQLPRAGRHSRHVQVAEMAEAVAVTAAAKAVKFGLGACASAICEAAKSAAEAAYMCRTECKRLAERLTDDKLATYLQELDALAEADIHMWDEYLQLCDLLEEAHCLVLACKAAPRWSLRRRIEYGHRISELRKALVQCGTSEQLHRVRGAKSDLDARSTNRKQLEQSQATYTALRHVPAQPGQGPLGMSSLQLPDPIVHIFQHMRYLVPKLQGHLRDNRRLGLIGMGGIGKTTIARELYDRCVTVFDHRIFVTVGRKPNLLHLLHSAFKTLRPGKSPPFNENAPSAREWLARELEKTNSSVLLVLDDVWETVRLALYARHALPACLTSVVSRHHSKSAMGRCGRGVAANIRLQGVVRYALHAAIMIDTVFGMCRSTFRP